MIDIIQLIVTIGCAGAVFWLVKGNPHHREPNTPKGRPSKELAFVLWNEGNARDISLTVEKADSMGRKYGPWAKVMVYAGNRDQQLGGSREQRFEQSWNQMLSTILEDEKAVDSESDGNEHRS